MKKPFDVEKAIAVAWEVRWKQNLENRKKGGWDYRGSSYYLTATDIEREVREMAEKEAHDSGHYGAIRIHTGRHSLLEYVRDWLHAQFIRGNLERHNFGRGHISGMRYRPKGEPIGPQALKTMAAKEARKGRPPRQHYTAQYGHRMLCADPKRRMWRPSKAWTTTDWTKVTCPRCLKLKGQAA